MLDKIAGVLLEREVLDAEEFAKLMNEDSDSDSNSESESESKTQEKPEVPELPETRVDNLPGNNRDFMA